MQKITNTAQLKIAIQQLESQQAAEWPLLKNQFRTTYESFKLINIIKSTFKEGISSPDLITNSLKAAAGLAIGLVTKKLLIGKTINPFKKMLGIFVEMFVAKNVVENASGLKSIGSLLLKKIGNKKVLHELG
jgi:hypothetical protein